MGIKGFLSKYILDTLTLFNLDTNKIVSQGYDGASVLSGCSSGVQQRIKEVVPHATYIHCHAHCLTWFLLTMSKPTVMLPIFSLSFRLSCPLERLM